LFDAVMASCEGSQVKVQGVTVEDVQILSKGLGESQGLLFVSGESTYYFGSSFQDVSDTIDKVKEAIDKIATILSSIGSGMTGATTAPPPTLATDLAELTLLSGELAALKGELR
jgi:hypothetical protein